MVEGLDLLENLDSSEQVELLNEISDRLMEVNSQLGEISIFLRVAIYLVVLGACAYLAWMVYRLVIKPLFRAYIKFPI